MIGSSVNLSRQSFPGSSSVFGPILFYAGSSIVIGSDLRRGLECILLISIKGRFGLTFTGEDLSFEVTSYLSDKDSSDDTLFDRFLLRLARSNS